MFGLSKFDGLGPMMKPRTPCIHAKAEKSEAKFAKSWSLG